MSHLCGHHRKPLIYGLFSVNVTKSSQNYHLKHHPERLCRSGFNRTGASKCTSAFSCFILFCPLFVQVGVISVWWFYYFHSAIFIIFCYLRYFCREQRLFLSGWIFSSFIISFPISTVLLLRPTHRIDFKVLTALLGFGYERLTFQGGVTTLP